MAEPIRAEEREEPLELTDGFSMTFASVAVILLSFFVYISSLATIDAARRDRTLYGVQQRFNRSSAVARRDRSLPAPAADAPLVATLRERTAAARFGGIPELAGTNGFTAADNDTHLTIVVPSDRLFAAEDDDVQTAVVPFLNGLATEVKRLALRADIGGHSDTSALSEGRFSSQWDLSAARAAAVFRYLLDAGVRADRMTAAGYGEFRPSMSNDTAEGRTANRRVIINLRYPTPAEKRLDDVITHRQGMKDGH